MKAPLYGIVILCLFFNYARTANIKQEVPQPRDDSVDIYITLCLINFSEAMRTGVPVLGIPVLDPFNITYMEVTDFNKHHLKLNANASDVSVQKYSYYYPDYVHVDFAESTMYINLSIAEIDVFGTYWCDGMYQFVFPVFGAGPFTMQVFRNLNYGDGAVFITPDGYLQISSLDLTIEFEELVFFFENFLGGGDFGDQINAALSQLAKLYFEALMPKIQEVIIPALVTYLNDALMQNTLAEIIAGAIPKPPYYNENLQN